VKVGDLVLCPTVGEEYHSLYYQNSYVGIIIGIFGHKVDIGGGPQGTEVWDKSDLTLIKKELDK